jgi:hypothetical protein
VTPPIGTAHAEKLVVAKWIGELTVAPTNSSDVRLAEVRTDADVRIARIRAVRQIVIAGFICLTIVLALYSPVLAALVGVLGMALSVYLGRVEGLAQTLVAGPTGATAPVATGAVGAATSSTIVSNAVLARVAWPIRYFFILCATIALVALVTPEAAKHLKPHASPPLPTTPSATASTGPNIASPPTSAAPKKQTPPPPRQPSHTPASEAEERVWSAFALALELELSKCDKRLDVGPGAFYSRPFTLTCFACPDDGIAQPLANAETNASGPLLTCYNDTVGGLLYQYVFPMPPGVGVLDNRFTHQSR